MTTSGATLSFDREAVGLLIRQYWGFDQLRPLQEEAIRAGLGRRDSLVVMPTGGGKSLCYQVPPLLTNRTDVVVSPLISLMKDQVDGLRECGYPAAALHGGMSIEEIREAERGIATRKFRLVFVAPERLLASSFLRLMEAVEVHSFAIDEAHCISHWGHDFRPEYRRLATLKQRFPRGSIHAFTATATERVRTDIVEQLQLIDPAVLIGNFDRPNLTYRVVPRVDAQQQIREAIRRHHKEAVIVYCISRRETERLAEFLKRQRIRAEAYHAGMEKDDRRRIQDAFAEERLDVIVATVAFGMGIDRSNVRCVIHSAMPKSIEHYQQETGRAGRDGLEAECVLFYSAKDAIRWDKLIRMSAEGANRPEEVIAASTELLRHIRQYCNQPQCRHASLVEYFGQRLEKATCGACDVCLGEIDGVIEGTIIAQKILSCVARVEQRFGVKHVADVLRGAYTKAIQQLSHDKLSTFGLLREMSTGAIGNMTYQLVDQELLAVTGVDRPVLKLNDDSWAVMRGKRTVKLIRPRLEVAHAASSSTTWEGVDRGLFEHLRELRAHIAGERGVAAFVVFADTTLRELAARRPTQLDKMSGITGIGGKKLADLGEQFAEAIKKYCLQNGLSMNVPARGSYRPAPRAPVSTPRPRSASRQIAFPMFADGESIEAVMNRLERSRGTALKYLVEYIQAERPEEIDAWVDRAIYAKVASAMEVVGNQSLKSVWEHLGGEVDYVAIQLVRAHINLANSA